MRFPRAAHAIVMPPSRDARLPWGKPRAAGISYYCVLCTTYIIYISMHDVSLSMYNFNIYIHTCVCVYLNGKNGFYVWRCAGFVDRYKRLYVYG